MQAQVGQAKRTSFSGFPGGNASILLEKAKAGIRGSTPDSEALASSDDEQDQHNRLHSITNTLAPKPMRRSSWLTEVQQTSQWKGSFNGSGAFSPASSHPTTPSGDQNSWALNAGPPTGSTKGRGHSNSTSFPWGNAIWNNDSQKGLPLRLSEVLPSPTSLGPPAPSGLYSDEPLLSPPLSRDNLAESSIPFAIPLQPTLKTYRSQSYSVGQLDPESTNAHPSNNGGHFINGRTRGGTPYAGLQHRPSRPSMLGEMPHDNSSLGRVREVEDDDGSSNGSESGVQLSTTQARTIEQLAMENALLRQAAANQIETTRIRNRAATTSSAVKGLPARIKVQGHHQRIHESVPEETDYAPNDLDEAIENPGYGHEGMSGRRFSEYGADSGQQYFVTGIPENRTLENVKKGQWQSSLGFGGIGEPPQSRRHSFADVPPRHGSISSAGESQNGFVAIDNGLVNNGRQGSPTGYVDGLARPSQGDSGEYTHFRLRQTLEEEALEREHLHARNFAASYFSRTDREVHGPSMSPASLHQAYSTHTQYSRSQPPGQPQPRLNQLLYVVAFKACRADVFYVHEGTGLQIKTGDLVIVEADRGTDLGTVCFDNITWSRAKELKEQYVEEHFRWLMMFSRHGQNGNGPGPNQSGATTTSNGIQISAIGGMGPGQTGAQETTTTELKPKMIKRLAQAHEIQTLRDKEGNEAKAKRVCQQKVVEHRLNMEILDAEFQMDWKKLTFYYFADAYINFNSLVTDLFKIYKTRIWMSAINPASFVTPVAGLQLPSGLGPGAFTSDRDHYPDRRQPKDNLNFTPMTASHIAPGGFDHGWEPSRDTDPLGTATFPRIYAQPFQTPNLENRPLELDLTGYRHGGQQSVGLHSPFDPTGYILPDLQHAMYTTPAGHSNGTVRKPHVLGSDWTNSFHGLSLGS